MTAVSASTHNLPLQLDDFRRRSPLLLEPAIVHASLVFAGQTDTLHGLKISHSGRIYKWFDAGTPGVPPYAGESGY